MRDAPQPQVVFPRIGRGTKIVLALLLVFGVLGGILANYTPVGDTFFKWLIFQPAMIFKRPWTLLTAALISNPDSYMQLVFTMIAWFFFAPAVEERWGTARFLRFSAIAIVVGNVLVALFNVAAPEGVHPFHPGAVYGSWAALAALGVAWGRENANAQMRLFFILPMNGRAFVWVTLGFCILGVFFPASVTEGIVAPFGGFITGLLLSGSPSPARALYLRAKLAFLRRKGERVALDIDKPKKRRSGGPPLRVVVGGLDDLEKRQTPKDKRYLN